MRFAAFLFASVAPLVAEAQTMPPMDMSQHAHHAASPPSSAPAPSAVEPALDPHAGHHMATEPVAAPPPPPARPSDAHDHVSMDDDDMAGMDHAGMAGMNHAMTGALGSYPMTREASGTAWQPDASQHGGIHIMSGDWMYMAHADLNAVYDRQDGPRGGEKSFVSGMVMGMAKRTFASGDQVQFRGMFSPDPLMGASGYPLLLATGETANGRTALVDHQHPHDLFMELSASYAHPLSSKDSVFIYAGLPGEPAFGPPAFMHRLSIMDSPEAPISHHWLDSTHITMGVVTGGYIHDNWKIEVSGFRGREPDQHRYDIESPKLDSTAVRVSWNPNANWSLQASWAYVKSPEQLEPDLNQKRWSASAIYTVPFGKGGWWSTTGAWGLRSSDHGNLHAWVLESAVKPNDAWTVFARAERVDNDELVGSGSLPHQVYTVGKVSVGAIHDWKVADHLKIGLGGLYAWNAVPGALAPLYGASDPKGAMAFIRLKID